MVGIEETTNYDSNGDGEERKTTMALIAVLVWGEGSFEGRRYLLHPSRGSAGRIWGRQ